MQDTEDESLDGRVTTQAPGAGYRLRASDPVTIFVADFVPPEDPDDPVDPVEDAAPAVGGPYGHEGRRPLRRPLLRARCLAPLGRVGRRRPRAGGPRGRSRTDRAGRALADVDGQEVELRAAGGLLGCDVAFPVLHGPFGEDGTVQGLLECLDVPYAGPSVLAAAVAMDKLICKRLLAHHGFPQVDFCQAGETGWREQAAAMGMPLWVKPSRLGSSVGITRVMSVEQELDDAVELALRHDPRVISRGALRGPGESSARSSATPSPRLRSLARSSPREPSGTTTRRSTRTAACSWPCRRRSATRRVERVRSSPSRSTRRSTAAASRAATSSSPRTARCS